MSEQVEEKKMTEEEFKILIEKHKADWEAFVKNLKDNPTVPVTNADLLKAIEFISEDMGGMGQMIHMLGNNLNILNHNLQIIMQAVQGGQAQAVAKTKGGIILPNG